jgi:DNA-binding CsgD family transcriptional regulator
MQVSLHNTEGAVAAGPGISRWIVALAAYGVTFLVMGILFKRLRFLPWQNSHIVFLAILTALGAASNALFTFFPTTAAAVTNVLILLGNLLMGSGTAMIHMEWGRLLGRLGPRKTVIHGALGTCGAAVCVFALFQMPNPLAWICISLLPIGCVATILRQRRTLLPAEVSREQVKLRIPWRFLCTSFIQGSAFGILQILLFSSRAPALTTLISVIGSLGGALALLFVVLLFRWDFNKLIYQVGFVLLALSFVLMTTSGSVFVGGWLINAIGYRFIDILMWALCVYLIKQRHLPTNWVFAVTTCALLMGQLFGVLVGLFLETALPAGSMLLGGDRGDMSLFAGLMVFIILVAALFLSNKKNLQVGWGMIRPGDEDGQADDFATRCALTVDGFGLTPREAEVFRLLALGTRRDEISASLYLSRETVKTHTRNIYRKMNLHSQQELMESVAHQKPGGPPADTPA